MSGRCRFHLPNCRLSPLSSSAPRSAYLPLEEPCKGLPPTVTVRINDQSGTVRDIRARVVTCNNDRCGLQTADGVLTVPKSAIASSVVSPPIPRSAAR
jgi:hypothetical protein